MIKRVDENGKMEFTVKEAKRLINSLGYNTTRKRPVFKILKKELVKALKKLI